MKQGQYPSTDRVYKQLLASTIPAATKRTVRNDIRNAERLFGLGRTVEGHQLLDRAERTIEKAEALDAMDEIVADYFAFQAAACTTQPDCQCGRH